MNAISGRILGLVLGCEPEEQRSPLGLTRSGRPVWPIRGAEGDDDNDDDDSDEDDDDDDDGDADDKKKKVAKTKAGKDDADNDDDDEDDAPVSAEDAARLKRRMKRADQRASKAENDLRELQRKGTPESEQSKADLEDATSRVTTLTEANRTLRLQNSFLLSNTFTWHDPSDVMEQVLKDEDVDIDDEGHVSGMEAVLKRIAKKKPYLLKTDSKSSDDNDDDDDAEEDDEERETRTRKSTASGGSQNRRKNKGGVDRAKILATYPALNRR